MSGKAEPDGTQLEPGEQARADVYRLLGALLAAPPDAVMIDLLQHTTGRGG